MRQGHGRVQEGPWHTGIEVAEMGGVEGEGCEEKEPFQNSL